MTFLLLVSIAFGGECRISDVVWNGDHEMADEADAANLVGMPCDGLNGPVWKNTSRKIQERYENGGFLAASLVGELLENPADSSEATNTAVLLLELNRGSAWVWGPAENMDSTGTKPEVFRKLTGLEVGSYVSPRDLERANYKLARVGYFEEVGKPRMYRDAYRNRIIPVFNMRAAAMSEAEALLTYSSENDLWEGNVNVSLYNILGTARDLQLEGYTAADSRRLEGSYKEPWIFGSAWNVIARGYFDEDSSTREAYGEVGISRDIGFDFTIGVFVGIGDNEKTSSLELTYTSLDRFALPRSGTKFYGLASWNFSRPDSLDHYLKVRGSLVRYVPVYANWITRFSGAAGGIFAPDADLDRQDLFALGGMNDFRGMDYRFLRSRAYGYTEFALLWQDGYDLSIEGFYMPGLYRAPRPDHGWKREQEYGLAFTQYRKNWSVNFYYALRNGESYLDGIVGVGVKTLF
ncbi:MAG: BamA/TamA family outer membrane protein [Fibrobacter sp.]|nr:BamA/TamA family outer membrane protein [Fibrobacter sp.]